MRRFVLLSASIVGLAATPAAASAGGGGGCYESTEGSGTTVEMIDACFTPNVLRVDEGTTVTFVNRDQVVHLVSGIGWSSGDMPPGAELAQGFDSAGTYAYTCYLHPSMNGVVVVGDGFGSGPVVQPVAPPSSSTTATTAPPVADEASDDSGTSTATAGVGIGGAALGFVAAKVAGRRRRPS